MDSKIIVLIAVVLIAVAVIAWALIRRQRTATLRRRFGPEYERTVRQEGQARGESVLSQREKRVDKLKLRDLTLDERERFVTEWRATQAKFVDDPKNAVVEADALVTRLMQARGYPMSDFDQRAADISVDHPHVVENYRAAREISLRHRQGAATTEDMRNALIYYRSLFDELLQAKTVHEDRAKPVRQDREVA